MADEAARLLQALGAVVPPEGVGHRYEPRREGPRGSGGSPAAAGEPCTCGSGMAPECRICPVCLGLRILRDKRPEVILALADLVADVATSLRAFADDRSRSWPADQAGASDAAARTGGAAAPDSAGGAAAPHSDEGDHFDGEEGHLV